MKLPDFLLFLGLALPLAAGAQETKPFRELTAVAPAVDFTSFRLEAKGGEVRINSATDDSIRVEVRMTMKAIPDEEAERRLERIQILDTIAEGRWSWRTDLDGMELEWLARLLDIRYEVFLPASLPLEVVQRNGNLVVGDREAPVWIDLRFGDLSAGCFSANGNRVEVQFGEASLACMGKGELTLTAGSCWLGEARSLKLRASGAEFRAQHLDQWTIEAHAGQYKADYVGLLSGRMTSSQLTVDTLDKEGDLTLTLMANSYVGLSANAQALNIDADLAPLRIRYPEGRLLDLDLEGKAHDLAELDIDNLPKPESLPDDKLRYRSQWGEARTAEVPLRIQVRTRAGKVRIEK